MRQSRSSTCGRDGVSTHGTGATRRPVPPVALTLASKLSLETGMFSGPPCTLKCLQPALALM